MAKEEAVTGNDLIVNGKRIDMLRVGKVHFVDSHVGRTGKIKGDPSQIIRCSTEVYPNSWGTFAGDVPATLGGNVYGGAKVEVIGEIRDSKNTRLIWWNLVKLVNGRRYWVSATDIDFD